MTVHPGDHGGGVTPVPIPNTAVKPSSADGTVRATWWESRTLPGFFVFDGQGLGFRLEAFRVSGRAIPASDRDTRITGPRPRGADR